MTPNVLALVAEIMAGLQLPKPRTVVNNPDPQVGQCRAALVDAAAELVERYPFTETLEGGAWLKGTDGTQKRAPSLDTDLVLIDAGLMRLAAKWRFLEANGLDYAESFRAAEEKVLRLAGERTVERRAAEGHEGGRAKL